jgi:hypothetical protein
LLDGTHHLQLAEADVAGIGTAPCGAVVAENIRNLQLRARHDRRLCYAGTFRFRRVFGFAVLPDN